jgi:hypothetical protein
MDKEKLLNMIIQAGNWFDANNRITYMKLTAQELKWNRGKQTCVTVYRIVGYLHFLEIMADCSM